MFSVIIKFITTQCPSWEGYRSCGAKVNIPILKLSIGTPKPQTEALQTEKSTSSETQIKSSWALPLHSLWLSHHFYFTGRNIYLRLATISEFARWINKRMTNRTSSKTAMFAVLETKCTSWSRQETDYRRSFLTFRNLWNFHCASNSTLESFGKWEEI